ncbi:gene transfer agent family protein [Paracoccus sp. DMF]|uniref:gene transfer agent family protein n=1 Tax=Paracoccus sp. DMF TaxID=400837 RepID=UPI0011009EC1|nr:gene transfer agent family protein [Paracoccus sp. DMF]MCV2448456.1 gene transfer agent family protein [Paracoccus sp. DMF]
MSNSPILHADLGDGKQRRFFLGYDELLIVEREAGRGFYSLFLNFDKDVEPKEVRAILRLALIGGGADPSEAADLVGYYAAPPRPLKAAYLIAYDCLSAAWNGSERKTGAQPLTNDEMDRYFADLEAAFVKGGGDTSVLRGKSFAEIQALLAALRGDKDAAAAPDADTFNAIKASAKKGQKK